MAFNYKKSNDDTLVVNDPIYGEITVPYPFSKIILTKELMRLGNISQNGFSQYEFKGLEHNDRLSHSVGAFYVMSLILNRLESVLYPYDIEISKDDKDMALCSMLLHDIGHGPFSHSLERVTHYSHEKRTIDIILGDTETGKLLTEIFGIQKLRQIANFIVEINGQNEIEKDSFTKLLKNLVSHQLDADRLDYLIRDAYYAGVHSSINLDKVISSLSVVVNENQEYELLINKNGLSSIENVLIQRYQMYRDVYLSPISTLGDKIFQGLLTRYKNNPKLHQLPVTDSFVILAQDPAVSNLSDFIKMTDDDFKKSFEVLIGNNIDSLISYLSDHSKLKDFILIENDISIDKIRDSLREIFGDIDLSDTLSIINVKAKVNLYKKEQRLNIQYGNRISDLTECTNLIRPQEALENTYTFFNPILLMIELGLTLEEFQNYESEVKKMIEDLNKKPEEFELKYIIHDEDKDDSLILNEIVSLFINNGFSIVSMTRKQNIDEYFDNKNLDLYRKGGSLRIRKAINKDSSKVKFKGTYKMPTGEGEVYSSRTEIEETLPDLDFNSFENKMKNNNIPVDFGQVVKSPVLNSTTNRIDVVLEKNGVQVCLSLDNSTYTNHFLGDLSSIDNMIEIEAIGELNDRIVLNEIHNFITGSMTNISINKQSKYERGIDSTLFEYCRLQKQTGDSTSLRESGIKFLLFEMSSKLPIENE